MSDRASGADDNDLEAFVRRADPDRWLSSRFAATAEARADLVALYAFDRELARIVRQASEPLVGEIRLAWWREGLVEIDAGGAARAHPGLQALERLARRTGLKLAVLDPLIDFHIRWLDKAPFADAGEVDAWLRGAASPTAIAIQALDPAADRAAGAAAAKAWSLARTDLGGRITFDTAELDALHRALLQRAKADARRLPAAAFPAVAHAALARTRSDRPSGLAARLRVTWAVARGRI